MCEHRCSISGKNDAKQGIVEKWSSSSKIVYSKVDTRLYVVRVQLALHIIAASRALGRHRTLNNLTFSNYRAMYRTLSPPASCVK